MAEDEEQGSSSSGAVGDRIRQAARMLGGRAQAAEAMGVSVSQYNRYVNGAQQPSLGSAMGMADAAGVSLDWLARGTDTDQEPGQISQGEEAMMHAVIARIAGHMRRRKYEPEPEELADLCLAVFRLVREDCRREEDANVERYNELIDLTIGRYGR